MVPSDAPSEEKFKQGPSNRDGMFGKARALRTKLSRAPPALREAVDRMGSCLPSQTQERIGCGQAEGIGGSRSPLTKNSCLPPLDPKARRVEGRQAPRRSAKLLARRLLCPSS